MQITLYMAISVNGYIAKRDHNTDWVCESDWAQLSEFLSQSDAVIMGRKTYEVSGQDFPYGEILNIVLTKNQRPQSKDRGLLFFASQNETLISETEKVIFTDKPLPELIDHLKSKGIKKVLIIGGGITNTEFLNANLIDYLVLSVHPIILGQGISLFANTDIDKKLSLIETKTLDEGLVQLRYKVLK